MSKHKCTLTRREFTGMMASAGAAAAFSPMNVIAGTVEKPITPLKELYAYLPQLNIPSEDFSICLWADPQLSASVEEDDRGGGCGKISDLPTELKTTEGRLRKIVEMTNDEAPDCVLVLGDVVHFSGEKPQFERYLKVTEGLKPSQYLLAGNHDYRDAQRLEGGYNSAEGREFFGNFRWAQRNLGKFDKVNYSFDAGNWHIIMFSIPGVGGAAQVQFLKDYPEHLSWLADDLEMHKDKPTIFCTHPPLLPVGQYSMEMYNPNKTQLRAMVDMLTKNGNVKICLSGHIHCTTSSMIDIGWRYKGATWLSLPTTSFDNVREIDYNEGATSSFGFGTIRVVDGKLQPFEFTTITGEVLRIVPEDLPVYDHKHCTGLWEDYELPAAEMLVNGNFDQPLSTGWMLPDIVENDRPPLEAVRRISPIGERGHQNALWLFSGGKIKFRPLSRFGHRVDIVQAIKAPGKGRKPRLSLDVKIPSSSWTTNSGGKQGAYILLTGHKRDQWNEHKEWHLNVDLKHTPYQWRLQYALGNPLVNSWKEQLGVFQINPQFDEWQHLEFDVFEDLKNSYGSHSKSNADLDIICITLGVWNMGRGNTGADRERVGVYFDNISWDSSGISGRTSPEFRLLTTKEATEMW